MRPLRLEIQGFTSFRERVSLDFEGLDLFAITGPTGAGKSSLIDAMVFALYGCVPRVGDDYKQLISQGAERLSVLFEFAVGGARYRVARTVRRERPAQQRLERLSASGGPLSISDRAREIRSEVERILGLDYDGFTRSVVLPQGQFDAFLKGEPKERQKILVSLLGLGIYERMQQLANQKAATARAEAEFLKKQLESDYAGTSGDALERARAELSSSQQAARQAETALGRLAGAAGPARAAREARREAASAARDQAEETRALAEATATLERANRRQAEIACLLEQLQRELETLRFDESRATTLAAARVRIEQLGKLAERLSRSAGEIAVSETALETAQSELGAWSERLPALAQAAEEAGRRETAARLARELAQREHAAVALRHGLQPGEPCPVCLRTLEAVPADAGVPELPKAEAALQAAEAGRRSTAERLQEGRLAHSRQQSVVDAALAARARLVELQRETRALAGEAAAALQQAGFLPIETVDPEALATRVEAELLALSRASRALSAIEQKRRSLEQEQARLGSEVAVAEARRDAARTRVGELSGRQALAQARLEDARRELAALGREPGWAEIADPPPGRDESDVVESLRHSAQGAAVAAATREATARQTLERAEQAGQRAEELRARRAQLEHRAELNKLLADQLKANELVAWILEDALARLARDGARHLALLSNGRYELQLGSGDADENGRADRDFYVVDRWNGDRVRSVRTLSGGETFLASLSLALALADGLTGLSSGGRAVETLESLFLDEGFGALDGDTLDLVVGALDALHGGQRMVGIVTHLRDLAERLPARVEVRRTGSASTIGVDEEGHA